MDKRRVLLLGYGAAFASAMLFSVKGIFAKKAYEAGASPEALLALRFGTTLPVFLWIARNAPGAVRLRAFERRDWIGIALLSVLGYILSSALDFHGLRYLSVGLERIILYAHPTLVVLFSALFFGKKLRPATGAALLLSYSGLALCFSSEVAITDPRSLWIGGALVFSAAITYAFFILGAERVSARVGMHRLTAMGMIASALFFGAQAAWIEGGSLFHLAPAVYFWAAVMGLVSTVLPVVLFGVGLRALGASNLSIASMAGPVAVLPIAAWTLGEPAGPAQWGGVALTLAGGLVLTRGKKPAASTPKAPEKETSGKEAPGKPA